ncbi:MAG: YybS family protein [Nitrospinota bacterium]|nr:YybS family protein [Nitrospinota bacterium]
MIGVMDWRQQASGQLYHLAPMALSVFLFYVAVSLRVPYALALAGIPLYYSMARHGREYAVTVAVGSSLAVFIISDAILALWFTSICVFMALAAAEALRRRAGLGLAMAMTALVPFLAVVAVFSITAQSSGEGMFHTAREVSEKVVANMVEQQAQAGGRKEIGQFLKSERETLVWVLSAVFPSVIFDMTLLLALLHHLMARAFSIRFGWGAHMPDHDLTRWRAPEKLVWVVLAGVALSLTGLNTFTAALGLNLLLATGMVYSLQGLSTVHHWLRKVKTPVGVNNLVYILLLVAIPWSVMLLCSLGLIDAALDLRSDPDKGLAPGN